MEDEYYERIVELTEADPCKEASDWLASLPEGLTNQEIWDLCPEFTWLTWFASYHGPTMDAWWNWTRTPESGYITTREAMAFLAHFSADTEAANARWDAWLLAAFRKLCPVVPTPDLDEGLEEYTEEEVDAIVFADEVNRPDQGVRCVSPQ